MARDEFLAWVEAQPEGRFELVDGHVVGMAPERVSHAQSKALAWLALRTAIRAAGVPCQAIMDGVAVEISDQTLYLPDTVVNCGDPPDRAAMVAPRPVIIVEVASPSTARVDAIKKFGDYFRIPTVRHYLILDAEKRLVLHHRKDEAGEVRAAIAGSGPLALDPPGITIQVEDLFEA